MGRICAVKGCPRSTVHLNKWRKNICGIHDMHFGRCYCKPPFALHPFPTERRDPEGRKRWIKAINRTMANGNWQPAKYARVCSYHFKDGEPSDENPDPTEIMEDLNETLLTAGAPRVSAVDEEENAGKPSTTTTPVPPPKRQKPTPKPDLLPSHAPRLHHHHFSHCDCYDSCCDCDGWVR